MKIELNFEKKLKIREGRFVPASLLEIGYEDVQLDKAISQVKGVSFNKIFNRHLKKSDGKMKFSYTISGNFNPSNVYSAICNAGYAITNTKITLDEIRHVHSINAILKGDNALNFENWNFPQTKNYLEEQK